MANGPWATESEVLAGTLDVETRAAPDEEGGCLLAVALTVALLEYRRQVRNPGVDAGVVEPVVEWRLLARWEQMAPPARSGGRGWA
jgi:hypothetical protein